MGLFRNFYTKIRFTIPVRSHWKFNYDFFTFYSGSVHTETSLSSTLLMLLTLKKWNSPEFQLCFDGRVTKKTCHSNTTYSYHVYCFLQLEKNILNRSLQFVAIITTDIQS